MKHKKQPHWLSPPVNHKSHKKFRALFCPSCKTICDSDEETAFCQCSTVTLEDVKYKLTNGDWKLAQVNISLASVNPLLPTLKKAKKGTIDVQK